MEAGMKPLQRLPDFPEHGEVDEALIEGVLGSDLTRARDLAGHRVMMRAKPRAGVDAGNRRRKRVCNRDPAPGIRHLRACRLPQGRGDATAVCIAGTTAPTLAMAEIG